VKDTLRAAATIVDAAGMGGAVGASVALMRRRRHL